MTGTIDLPGFDNRGKVAICDGKVLRRISSDYRDRALELLKLSETHKLSELGFVPASINRNDDVLVIEHPLYPITFPYEWPSLALKEAALFHLKLLQELDARGLTLKDCLPENVLFEGGQPRFVDFLSLVRTQNLPEEAWLEDHAKASPCLRTRILRDMFEHHFLIPLLAYEAGMPDLARMILRSRACRMTVRRFHMQDLVRACPRLKLPTLLYRITRYLMAVRKRPPESYARLAKLVASISLENSSGYASYYKDKDEDFEFARRELWKDKQASVHDALEQLGGTLIYDLGANTGWYSRLAAHNGARVVATDVDEATLNAFFMDNAKGNSGITIVKCSWADLTMRTGFDGSTCQSNAYFSSLLDRHQPDTIMMLGLIHHLTLGEGRSLSSVFSLLADNCKRGAVVEFVALDDALIASNPSYFENINIWNSGNFNLEVAVSTAEQYFDEVKLLRSHPDTRTIMLLVRS